MLISSFVLYLAPYHTIKLEITRFQGYAIDYHCLHMEVNYMYRIFIKMLGIPEIKKDGTIINIAFKKAEALFYYLLIKKKTTRDELIGLLWSDISEGAAKGNLRNSLYVIRKAFEIDIIKPDQKQVVTINENVQIVTDLDMFLNNEYDIESYSGDLLKGFYLNDCEEYEQWLLNQREYYNKLYIDRLHSILKNSYSKDDKNTEKYCKLLIEADRYDESPYRTLMELYRNCGQFNNAVYVYKKLENTLRKELSISPSVKTKDIYNKIVKLKNIVDVNSQISSKDFFYGRDKEIGYLVKNFQSFMASELYHSTLINGEAGIGKTKLLNRFLKLIDKSQVYLFQADCYLDENNCMLKPWNLIIKNIINIIEKENISIPPLWKNNIIYVFPFLDTGNDSFDVNFIEKTEDMNYQVVEEALSNIINVLSCVKKVVIIFEDMQWIDKASLSMLMRIIMDDMGKNVLFLGTTRDEYHYELDKFSALLGKYDNIDKLILHRFNKGEVFEFLDMALPDYNFNEKQKEKIFEETEGNTYFMVEVLNSIKENIDYDFMTSKMKDFINITGDKRQVLNVISLFFDGVRIDMLKELTSMDEHQVIDMIEDLGRKSIIEQKLIDNEVIFRYTHQKLRKYIYENLSIIRRRVLHEKAGQVLERSLRGDQNDALLYSKILYNYSKSENRFKTLEYTLKNANVYLDYNHELYPKCSIPASEKDNIMYFTNQSIIPYLNRLEEMINRLEVQRYNINEILRLEIMLNLMRGRYLIRMGQYDEGVSSVKKVIEDAAEVQNYEFLLMGHRQMIYYCIQANNIELMKEEIQTSLEISEKIGNDSERAVLLRLKGLNKIMSMEYVEAESLLKESVILFERLNQRQNVYSLNIAADYNYIGEIKRLNVEFEEAIKYYDKAIEICKKKGVIRGLAIFYANAGRCAIENNDYKKGEGYLKDALYLYNKTSTLSGRAIAESLMSLIRIRKENYDDALRLLKDAEKHGSIQNKAFELSVFTKVQAIIKYSMKDNLKLRDVFNSYLQYDIQYYADKAIQHFDKLNESYEIETLKSIVEKY